jgi:hypothetical protein
MQPKMDFTIAKNVSLKEKFKKEIYKLDNVPRLLYMDSSDVFVNKHAPYPNEIDSLNSFNWHENKVRTEKLKCTSYSCWEFIVEAINSAYFDSREKLDDLFVPKESRTESSSCFNLNKISINDAFDILNVKVRCNMDYYLKHPEEMEKDLSRKIKDEEFNSPMLEQELFYTLMCKILGDSEPSDKLDQASIDETSFGQVFMLKDFHLLSNDGNIIHATAKRGDFYLLFFYAY